MHIPIKIWRFGFACKAAYYFFLVNLYVFFQVSTDAVTSNIQAILHIFRLRCKWWLVYQCGWQWSCHWSCWAEHPWQTSPSKNKMKILLTDKSGKKFSKLLNIWKFQPFHFLLFRAPFNGMRGKRYPSSNEDFNRVGWKYI